MTRVLVTYASLHGATAGIAGWLADELRARGHDAHAAPAAHVTGLDDVDAVVIGSAVYNGCWVEEAADLVSAQAPALRTRPVWLFSSGSVADLHQEVPGQQDRLAELVGARGSVSFGGALDRATTGPVSGHEDFVGPGDWRDEHAVRAWAREIAAALSAVPSEP